MMMGLRLTNEGVGKEIFRARFDAELENIFQNEIGELMRYGLLEWGNFEAEENLRLTKQARLLGNQVFQRFVD